MTKELNKGQDPLKEFYAGSVKDTSERIGFIKNKDIALLVIDMQFLDAAEGYGVFQDVTSSGVPIEAQEYYFSSLKECVIPNIQRLQKLFRELELEVIHTRIQALTKNGRDRSNGHKRLKILASPGSKESEFLPEIAPIGDEIVINKTSSGVFASTNMNYVLKNIGINELYVVGVYTNECVETTVRDACDLGYLVTVIDDGCTTVNPKLHEATITTLKDRYAKIMTTEEAIKEIKTYCS